MNKQELAHIARLMYDLQEYCSCEWDESEDIPCQKCPAGVNALCDLFEPRHGIPRLWGITKADIERLERAELIDEVREKFMTVVYDELSDDVDNIRANRIIDAADEYVEEIMR